MPESVLTTKLFAPSTYPELVSRLHLYERLDKGLTRKLTLVSAPTGFGKSTLVTGWLSEKAYLAAWLSLDQGDNDPARFWMYLIAAIQTIHDEIGKEALQIVSVPKLRSIEPVAISLINDIFQLDQDLILILDFPDTQKAMKTSVGLTKMLGIAFTTAPAVSVEEFDKLMT